MYCINGKAGSGKSTLMRYIVNDPRALQYLFSWTQQRPVSIASFFFFRSVVPWSKDPRLGYYRPCCSKSFISIRHSFQQFYCGSGLEHIKLKRALPSSFAYSLTVLMNLKEIMIILQKLFKKDCSFWIYQIMYIESAMGGFPRPVRELQDLTKNDIEHFVR